MVVGGMQVCQLDLFATFAALRFYQGLRGKNPRFPKNKAETDLPFSMHAPFMKKRLKK